MKTRAKNTICFLVAGIDFFISKGYPHFPYSLGIKLIDGLTVSYFILTVNKSGLGTVPFTALLTTRREMPLTLWSCPLITVKYGFELEVHLDDLVPTIAHNLIQVLPLIHSRVPPELCEQYSIKKSG